MQGITEITGMVLKAEPINDYDRRVVFLTKEKGKISAFARGARKPNSKLLAATNPFCFGTFKLYEGKSSYNVADVEIQNYFEPLRRDYIGAYYGMYFAELADYYTRENNDERQMLKLLYQSLRALCAPSIPNELVRCIYEIKSIAVNGEFPGIRQDRELEASTVYALEYIVSSSVEKLYTFTVTPQVLAQLQEEARWYCGKILSHEFKSLEILQSLC